MLTKKTILTFLQDWGHDLVELGKLNGEPDKQHKAAATMIQKFYGYDSFPVLFKPTKASDIPFRHTAEGALSYFIGQNPNFPEDHGFALAPWTKVEFKFAGLVITDNVATTMGHYFFTYTNGDILKVEFSFVITEDNSEMPKILLHHSSLPYKH